MFLHGEAMTVAHGTRARVCPVRAEKSSLARIGQISGQNLRANALAKLRIFHRKDHLDPFVEIPLHPVGAAKIEFGLATVCEKIDTAVLEKSADDTAHADAAAKPAHARDQRALTPHDQIDLHARLG